MESSCISKNQSSCLLAERVIANVHNGIISIRTANYTSQIVRICLLAYAEEV